METCNNRVFLKGGRRIPVGCSVLRYAITEGGVALSIFETMVLMIAFATLVVTIIDHKK